MGTLQRVAALPLAEEDLTPEFLGQALGHDIASLGPSGAIRGTGTKLFFDVTYTDADSDGPASICVKGGFGEQVRSFGVAEAYVLEAIFYGDIAARTTLRLPTCYYAAIDDQRTQGIVILEDLRGTGYTFGEPTQPWTPEAVAAGLEQQAMWHAATWNAAADAQGGLGLAVGSTSVRAAAPFLFPPSTWIGSARCLNLHRCSPTSPTRWDSRLHFRRYGHGTTRRTSVSRTVTRTSAIPSSIPLAHPGFLTGSVSAWAPGATTSRTSL